MSASKWFLPILAASGTLMAQTLGDLNGLTSTASRYVNHGLGGTHGRMAPELCKINGDNGGNDSILMTRSTDVVHWTFRYQLGASVTEEQAPDKLPEHNSLTVQSKRGIFGDFKYSPDKVMDAKSVEYAWIGISLGDAIRQLNYNGYSRGFSAVTLMRPADPKMPDEYVYVFTCPWERTRVAVSTQTGALTWVAQY